MIHIFIEFERYNSSIETKHYCIDKISTELYDYLISDKNAIDRYSDDNIKTYSADNIKINRIKKLEHSDLKLYQQIFGFVGEKFVSVNNTHILYIAEQKFLKTECIKLINSIFDIIKITDPKFDSVIRSKYKFYLQNDSDMNFKIFRANLIQWKKYLDYKKYIQDFKFDNNWDTNLNTILDQYLNPNPYHNINEKYFFISRGYLFNIDEVRREEIIEFLNTEEPKFSEEFTSDKYYECCQGILNLLKYMDTYNTDVIYGYL